MPDIEVTHAGDKVTLKLPTAEAALSATEANSLASRIIEAAARAGGEDPVENDWVRLPMQYIRLAAERFNVPPEGDDSNSAPAPGGDEPQGDSCEVHCWIRDQTHTNAMHIAIGSVTEEGWFAQEVIEHESVSRDDFADTDYLEYYEKALVESEVFLFEIEEGTEGQEGSADAQ